MYTYEKFIVYPGPHYEKHSTAIQRSGVSMEEPFYLMNNKKLKNLDNCRYVVKRRTSFAAVLRWRVDIDMKYIQLYWSTHLHHSKNNNHGILIRLKNNNHVILGDDPILFLQGATLWPLPPLRGGLGLA